jgi:Short C-terminal domain
MSSRRLARISLAAAGLILVVSVVGFIVSLVLNLFFLDKYNAYGEVPIPGSGSVHLPAGEATISLHVLVVNGNGGLPVPPLGVTITPPDGVPQPVVTESIGSTTTVNNDAHIRVWNVRVPAEGTYNITTDGQVGGFINPRLAFGHQSSYGFLVWAFVGLFVAGLIDLALSMAWVGRTRKKAVSAAVSATPQFPIVPVAAPRLPPTVTHEVSDSDPRLERLKTLASLRESGALTEEEFQSEKRRILGE